MRKNKQTLGWNFTFTDNCLGKMLMAFIRLPKEYPKRVQRNCTSKEYRETVLELSFQKIAHTCMIQKYDVLSTNIPLSPGPRLWPVTFCAGRGCASEWGCTAVHRWTFRILDPYPLIARYGNKTALGRVCVTVVSIYFLIMFHNHRSIFHT